jgi:hypothetical protein
MRTLSSSILAALVVIALFWGNCFSCPQALLTLQTDQPAHQCCHKTKHEAASCQSQNLQQFVKADQAAPAPVLAAVATVTQPAVAVIAGEATPTVAIYSPPDLLSLHSSFRI